MTAPIAAPSGALSRLRAHVSTSVVIVLVAAMAGFLLVGQIQGRRRNPQPLAAESEGDLTRILANLNAEADALQSEISDLKVQLIELRRSSQNETEAAAAVDEQIKSLEVLAGTVPVTGPGVIVTINDPSHALTYDAMIDVVEELRDAGAEAIAVDNLRIGVATSFSERDGRLAVDAATLDSPYRILAIGQPTTLEGGLKIPGGAIDSISTIKGVTVEVQKQARVDLPPLAKAPAFSAARPIASKP